MADVVSKTNPTAGVRLSVNTPNFPTADWLINPLIGGVAARNSTVPAKYWKVTGGTTLEEMTAAEKAVVDAQELADVPPEQASTTSTLTVSGGWTTYLELDRNANTKHRLTGDYRITWSIELSNVKKAGQVRLYDSVTATVLDGPYIVHAASLSTPVLVTKTIVLRAQVAQGRVFRVQRRAKKVGNAQRSSSATIDVQRVI